LKQVRKGTDESSDAVIFFAARTRSWGADAAVDPVDYDYCCSRFFSFFLADGATAAAAVLLFLFAGAFCCAPRVARGELDNTVCCLSGYCDDRHQRHLYFPLILSNNKIKTRTPILQL